jgi:mono/diheme cytochrome c family protein
MKTLAFFKTSLLAFTLLFTLTACRLDVSFEGNKSSSSASLANSSGATNSADNSLAASSTGASSPTRVSSASVATTSSLPSSNPNSMSSSSTTVVEGDPVIGKLLYEKGCIQCHGTNGKDGKYALDSTKETYKHSKSTKEQELRIFIYDWMVSPQNKAICNADNCTVHIASYIRSWNNNTSSEGTSSSSSVIVVASSIPSNDSSSAASVENSSIRSSVDSPSSKPRSSKSISSLKSSVRSSERKSSSEKNSSEKSSSEKSSSEKSSFAASSMKSSMAPSSSSSENASSLMASSSSLIASSSKMSSKSSSSASSKPSLFNPLADIGKVMYQASCQQCHGTNGMDGTVLLDPTKTTYKHSKDAQERTLSNFIYTWMIDQQYKSYCAEAVCGDALAAYIRTWPNLDWTPVPVQAVNLNILAGTELATRLSAGSEVFEAQSCSACHGSSGLGDSAPSLQNCKNCTSWDQLYKVISTSMPSKTAPCTGACGRAATDWIWNSINGKPLTSDGKGLRSLVDAINFGSVTLQNKTLEALVADYYRELGAIPPALQAFQPRFNTFPADWYKTPSLRDEVIQVALKAANETCATKMPVISSSNLSRACNNWAEVFWRRPPTNAEKSACIETANTTNSGLTPEQRTQFACAAMFLAIPTLTY